MARHYKHTAESKLGMGTFWYEIEDGRIVRQVEAYGEIWRWGDEDRPQWLSDQPESSLDLEDCGFMVIEPEEFEDAWTKARAVGNPIPDAHLAAKELEEFAGVWRALGEVLFDDSTTDTKTLKAEFFRRAPRDQVARLMERADRFLAATSKDEQEAE